MIKYLKKSFVFWIGAAVTAVGLFLGTLILGEISKEIRYSRDGQIAVGTVQAKRIDTEPGDKGRIDYFYVVSYEFDPLTIPVQSGENDVDETIYEELSIGDQIDVEYLAGDPTTHRLAGTDSGWAPSVIMGGMAAIILPIGLLLLIVSLRRAMRQSRLWNHGTAHTARVVEFVCHNKSVKQEDRHYLMVYEYEGPDGDMRQGKSQYHTWPWFGRIAEGDTIDIVVDPKDPDKSEWRREME